MDDLSAIYKKFNTPYNFFNRAQHAWRAEGRKKNMENVVWNVICDEKGYKNHRLKMIIIRKRLGNLSRVKFRKVDDFRWQTPSGSLPRKLKSGILVRQNWAFLSRQSDAPNVESGDTYTFLRWLIRLRVLLRLDSIQLIVTNGILEGNISKRRFLSENNRFNR